MSLENQIEASLSEALKNKDKNVFSTLRLIIAAIKDVKISKKIRDVQLKDQEVISILKKMVKQRNDSCEAYKKAGRNDLLDNEKKEIQIIEKYLPSQLSESEIEKICKEVIQMNNASSMKDMGKVMGVLKSKYGDVIDFSKASNILKSLLK
tara:strand:+ start:94 stop:546 length:453 start_codon:yes stop_codon:yes gene_type:complete